MQTTSPAFITIPAVGFVDSYSLDPLNRAHVAALIRRANAYFALSAEAYEQGTSSGHPDSFYIDCAKREKRNAAKGEALLAPLGIVCDWPGLNPSFTITATGNEEHTTAAAVLAALGHPRNWLTA